MTARIDWVLALVALAVAPPLLIISLVYRRRLRFQQVRVKRLESGAMSVAQEALGATRVVRAFGAGGHEARRFDRGFRDGMWARIKYVVRGRAGGAPARRTDHRHRDRGRALRGRTPRAVRLISVGDLVVVMSYMAQLYSPVETLGKKAGEFQEHLTGAERVYSLLDEEPDVRESSRAKPLQRAQGDVRFEHASFSYDGADAALEDLSCTYCGDIRRHFQDGEGKTTLVNLLNRFYDPTEGRILLDGVDLRDYKVADLRAQFAILLQEPLLFSTTIAENIAYREAGRQPGGDHERGAGGERP